MGRMTRTGLIVTGLATLLAVVGIGLLASTPDNPGAAAETMPLRALTVRVPALAVAPTTARDAIEVSGQVKPIRRVALSAEVAGRIAALGAREHDAVRAGQVLVQIDDSLLTATRQRADAALLRTRSAHRLAQLELERYRSLQDKGVVSAAELDRARHDERAAFGARTEAEALQRETGEMLARAVIRAPFDGVLADLDFEVGDRLEVGQLIGVVLDLSEVEVVVGVTDREIVALHAGDAVTLSSGAYAGQRFPGAIRRVASALDEQTRKFPVEIVAANPERRLLPGMVVTVSAEAGVGVPAIRIPRQAIVEQFGITYVYVLDAQGDGLVATRRRIGARPVAFRPTEVQVVEGLAAGERIATGNLRSLSDGIGVVVAE